MTENIEEMVKEKGQVVWNKEVFYLREQSPIMKEEAKDGIYTSKNPFIVPWSDDITKGDYLNIISFSKGKIFYFNEGNAIFPPVIRLKLLQEDENTFIWECVSQKFSYKYSIMIPNKKYSLLLYLTIFFGIADVILFILIYFNI